MNTGDRIKQRRVSLGLSADELAERIGKSRATIYRYENGDIENMPTTVLEPLARALETTPADLMGWEPVSDEDIANAFVQDSLENIIDSMEAFSPKEKTYFKKYLQLIEINRLKADKYVDQLLSIQDMEADLALQAAHERTDIKVTKEMKKHDDDIMNDSSEWE